MSMSAGQRLRIGDRVLAAECGRTAARDGAPRVVPSWCVNSKALGRAFRAAYNEARRQEEATDGPAR